MVFSYYCCFVSHPKKINHDLHQRWRYEKPGTAQSGLKWAPPEGGPSPLCQARESGTKSKGWWVGTSNLFSEEQGQHEIEGNCKGAGRKNKEYNPKNPGPKYLPGEFRQEGPGSTGPEMVEVFHGFVDDL
jgi:hypothetical protein